MKPWWLISIGILGSLLGVGILSLITSQPRGEPISLRPPPTPLPIIVHVTGAVAHPGVYTLPPKSRWRDAAEAAGGFLSNANIDLINLAAFLQDGEQIHIPNLDESKLEPAPLENSFSVPEKSPVMGLININIADQSELESLPGIGPQKAKEIIAYREANGLFKQIEDILDVPGIGEKTFEDIKGLITVDG